MDINGNMFIEAHIADLHFGAFDPKRQYKILKEQFIDELYKMPVLDIVSVNGDVFHHKFMANSDAVSIACYFITDLVNLCAAKNATLLIISGTYSHDADQIKLFYPIANQARSHGIDVRIVEEARFEYIKGKTVLCIPELYGMGAQYYIDLLYGKGFYDSCYMHGTFVGSIYGKNEPNLNAIREPVFCMDDFQYCLGPIISGHVHIPQCLAGHFYYCGSPYRWQFGEEQQKGFIILLQDISNHSYAVSYQPIVSDKYITLSLQDMVNNDPQLIIEHIDNKMKEDHIDYIRVLFESMDESNFEVLKTYYRNFKNITVVNDSKNNKIVRDMEDVQERYGQYSYLFDKNITPEEKLVDYINQCKGSIFVTKDELINLLKNL